MSDTLHPINAESLSNSRSGHRGGFFIPGTLTLADGTTYQGQMPQWQRGRTFSGEVVFSTGMTGYIESLTDPSYSGQILVFTYPLIGNYGVDVRAGESSSIHAAGVIVSSACDQWSHGASDRSLLEWLKAENVPILTGVDTRALTKQLRTGGTMLGGIAAEPLKTSALRPTGQIVSITAPETHGKGGKHVILVDCGAKDNILRSLLDLGLTVTKVPHDYDYTREQYDGVLLGNGPGDPADYKATIAITRKALQGSKPIFGICLGSQIMALAAGGSTYRLKFGHRGHNVPCLDLTTERGVITSQNHGYAVSADSLPRGWRVLFRNLNDDSVEGITHTTKPFFAVQFHPEACPGPTDTAYLFQTFKEVL